jgi:hypothetical protein
MKMPKLPFVLLFILLIFTKCPLFSSNTQAATVISEIANPPYIQPLNLSIATDKSGNTNFNVGIQLIDGNGPITFSATALILKINPINYVDDNGNMHYSTPVNYMGSVSQTLTYPTSTNIIQSLPLLSTPIIPNTFNTSPDPQTGDYDRYLITVEIGYGKQYFQQGSASGYYYTEIEFNDLLAITNNSAAPNFSLQYCIGHRNYYLQSNDNFNNSLPPYPDNASRW